MRRSSVQYGFTLVEIAFALVIFSIVTVSAIYGVRAVKQAKVKAFIIQITQVKNAAETFKQRYGTWPGDFSQATTRLRNCNGIGAAPFCGNGNGDLIIASSTSMGCRMPNYEQEDQDFPCKDINNDNETAQFWRHLVLADQLDGIKLTSSRYKWGDGLPKVRMGGGLQVIYNNDPNNKYVANYGSGSLTGHFISYQKLPNLFHRSFEATGDGVIAPWDSRTIDTEIDDGAPLTGKMRSTGSWGCGNVLQPNKPDERVYTEVEHMQCFILYKFDQ